MSNGKVSFIEKLWHVYIHTLLPTYSPGDSQAVSRSCCWRLAVNMEVPTSHIHAFIFRYLEVKMLETVFFGGGGGQYCVS